MMSMKFMTVAVHDLDTAVENYQRMFGLKVVQERFRNPITNAFDMVGLGYTDEVFIFLATPVDDDSAMRRLMRDRANPLNPEGEGIYHIAFESDDQDALIKQIEAGGGTVTRVPDTKTAWVHPVSSNFVMMELLANDD